MGILGDSAPWPHTQAGSLWTESSSTSWLRWKTGCTFSHSSLFQFIDCFLIRRESYSKLGFSQSVQDCMCWWWFCCDSGGWASGIIVFQCLNVPDLFQLQGSSPLGRPGTSAWLWYRPEPWHIYRWRHLSVFPNLPGPSQCWGLPCWILAEKDLHPGAEGGPAPEAATPFANIFPSVSLKAVLYSLSHFSCVSTLCNTLDCM